MDSSHGNFSIIGLGFKLVPIQAEFLGIGGRREGDQEGAVYLLHYTGPLFLQMSAELTHNTQPGRTWQGTRRL